MTPQSKTMNSHAFTVAALSLLAWNSLAQNGSLDTGFQAEANATVRAIAVQTNGQILIAGAFSSVNGVPRNCIARLNSDGELDRTFDPGSGADGPVNSVAVQADGKILIGGFFTTLNGTPRNRIARLQPDGNLDPTFDIGTGANDHVYVVAVETNGQILIAGAFSTVNTSNRSRIARLNSSGSLDTGFNTSRIDDGVHCVAVQPNGRYLIGGYFRDIGGTPRGGIARLRADGSLDVSFYPGSGAGTVLALVLQDDGKIVIAGGFNYVDGVFRDRIARLNSNGSLDLSLNPGTASAGALHYCVALQLDAKLSVGGYFMSINGVARSGIARLNSDGSLDGTFAPGLGLMPVTVYAMAAQSDGKLLVGGDFTRVNGVPRVRIARLNADVPSPAAMLSLKMYAGLTISGQTGTTQRIEYTTNFANPTLWRTLTDLSLSNPPQLFIDTSSPYSPRRFYRAVTLPER